MRHLHSLLHVAQNEVVFEMFSGFLEAVSVSDVLDIIRDVLKHEMFETSKQCERWALFVLHILPVFDQVQTKGLIQYLRNYLQNLIENVLIS